MYDDLVEFLQESVTPFHAAATAESWLRAAGFTRLAEADYWNLEPGILHHPQRLVRAGMAYARGEPSAATQRGQPQRLAHLEASRPTSLRMTAPPA